MSASGKRHFVTLEAVLVDLYHFYSGFLGAILVTSREIG